jgi:two-component system, NarL family, response regulator DevR
MIRVLMVDDSAPLRERLAARLVNLGTVEIIGEASDVPQAIHAVLTLKPDVVVLDIEMPGGSGFDVLKVVKKVRPEALVIMLTNYPCAPFRWRAKLMGAEYLFDKTAEFEKVADVLRTLHQEEKNG